jgi:hypothetical protein
MHPFVDELHIVEWCFWKERYKRKYPNYQDTDARKRVVFDEMKDNSHVFMQFWCKIKNLFIFLQTK